jgi:hypothetical protein
MPKINAFVTPPYPVLFSVAGAGQAGVPRGEAELLLGLLVGGVPSFLAAHRVPEESVDDLVVSLQQGDPRVAVAGMWVESPGEVRGKMERRSAAFISLVCADGRRITVARVLGEEPESAPDVLARHVIRQIARGVQVPDLVGR